MSVLLRWAALFAVMALSFGAIACGGDDDGDSGDSGDTQATGDDGSVEGAWEGEYETGTDVSIELFVPASDPALAKFEELRKAVNAPAVVYGRVTAKNTGSKPDTGRFVTLTDSEGEQFEEDATIMNFACALAYRWSQTPAISNEAIEAYTGLYNTDCAGATIAGRTIQPGETVTFFVGVEGESEPGFERVFAGAGNEFEK